VEREEFLRLADQTIERVVKWLDGLDPDEVDYSSSDGVLTLEFADKKRYVLNRQTAADQMWFAAGARAWHYDFDAKGRTWIDDRDGHDLYRKIGEVVSEKLGRTVVVN
jgi:CyaY protein